MGGGWVVGWVVCGWLGGVGADGAGGGVGSAERHSALLWQCRGWRWRPSALRPALLPYTHAHALLPPPSRPRPHQAFPAELAGHTGLRALYLDDNLLTCLPAGAYLDGLRVLGVDWRVLFKCGLRAPAGVGRRRRGGGAGGRMSRGRARAGR